jgi:demethylmenaquinone methyltransferase/2-methoxy-6-polyprenyl-1,4-benzoquinol methylase
VKAYYDARAREYDDVWLRRGRFAHRRPAEWFEEVTVLLGEIASLPAAKTLDVACGTGFLTRHLHGDVTGLDQSPQMLDEARRKVPDARFVEGDALDLPFDDDAFDRVFTSFFYGHLESGDRERFVGECHRVAGELVFVDASRERADVDDEQQERVLNDGSTWSVYKRYFRPEELAQEVGGGEILHAGRSFVMVRGGRS